MVDAYDITFVFLSTFAYDNSCPKVLKPTQTILKVIITFESKLNIFNLIHPFTPCPLQTLHRYYGFC